MPLAALIVGLLCIALAFSMDAGVWRQQAARLQEDVDMAAYAVSIAKEDSMSAVDVTKMLQAHADRLPAESGATSFTLTDLGNNRYRVTGTRATSKHFSRILGINAPTLSSTAEISKDGEPAPCVLATNTSPAGGRGIEMNNNARMTISGCSVQSNATGAGSVHLTQAFITVTDGSGPGKLCHGGGVYEANGNAVSATKEQCPAAADPLASSLGVPVANGTTYANPGTDYSWYGSKTFQPGIYSSGFVANNGRTHYLQAGTYYVTGGNFEAQSGAKVIANGPITIIVMNGGTIRITDYSSTENSFQAPQTGPYAGVLLWRVNTGSCPDPITFAGGAGFKYDGILYFPGCLLDISNDAAITTRSDFTYVLADRIKMVGGSRMNIDVDNPYGLASNLGGGGGGGNYALVK
ncbi:hypothetical protein [Aquisalinus flavus]|nr:hypothetical protein [Aquisalinus flavus]MBD0427596.1 hypothetical protein [Aquisalinus flavus]UNE47386.1 hypothetical protein FF099_04570 [Aquisalinus flavus]